VLSPFYPEERPIIAHTLTHAVMALELYLSEGLDQAMNRFNNLDEQEGAN
jgi:peptidyl-tRNA hydrolase